MVRRETGLNPPVNIFTDRSGGGASFVDHSCYLCFICGMLSYVSVY